MIETSSSPAEQTARRHILSWLLSPIALFPLAALMTYDWHAIPALCAPHEASSNWIGALGDCFAYHGYAFFGLAIWIVPLVCIISAICFLRGRRLHMPHREMWFAVFLVSVSCLLQAVGDHAGPVAGIARQLNIAEPGGAIGYLLMSRMLSPLLSDFGAAILMSILMTISLIGAVGLGNIVSAFVSTCRWALGASRTVTDNPIPEWNSHPAADEEAKDDPFLAAKRAMDEVRRQREADKQRIREEKLRQKEIARAEKEAARIARRQETAGQRQPMGTTVEGNSPAETPNDKGPYILPPISLLDPISKSRADHGDVGEMSTKLIDTLKLFGIDATLSYTVQGPVVTKYALQLAPGTKYTAVTGLEANLMGALHARSLRIEAPIPGEEAVGVEVPNRAPAGISFREVFESEAWREFRGELPLLFGKDAAGKELIADLASMPHMLVAGATGQGKSVCLNSLINGLLMTKTPEELKLIMVDPKSVEFTSYAALPHLIVPIITENQKVVFSLKWAVAEMEKRLKLFARAHVKNIYDFNHRLNLRQTELFGDDSAVSSDMPRTLPYIVIIIDEVADLMSQCSKEVSPHIARLTAKARAAGIHLILATQRPDARIITGAIKANIPGRVAFKTATGIDSRTILDTGGAENLIGRGDMLFKSKDGLLIRAQGAWISDPEIASVVRFIEEHSTVQFDSRFTNKLSTIKEAEEDIFADPAEEAASAKTAAAEERAQVKADAQASDFKKAVECVINTHRASVSHFQRQLGWGYNHAAKILDMLENRGIVSPSSGMGPRQIIMDQDSLLEIFNAGEGETTNSTDGPASEDSGEDLFSFNNDNQPTEEENHD